VELELKHKLIQITITILAVEEVVLIHHPPQAEMVV
jgi:hypothetical protein